MFTKENAKDVVVSKVPPYFKDTATLRIVEASNDPSKSGLPMVTLKCEIISPEKVKAHDGLDYALDALSISMYFPLASANKPEATPRMQKEYFDLREKLGLNPEFDETNPDVSDLEGICFEAILGSEESTVQRKKPDGTYEAMLGPDKKPISKGWQFSQIRQSDVLGRAPNAPNRSY